MPTIEEIPIRELPQQVIESAARDVAEYSIGFARVEGSRSGQDAVLLGSGTLVSIGAIHAVLTAHHVVSILPRTGRLGLILSPTLQQPTIDTQELFYLQIDRGTIESDGPDLGAIVLGPSIAGAIAAKKTFYNLDLRRAQNAPGTSASSGAFGSSMASFTKKQSKNQGKMAMIGLRNFTT